MTCSVHLTTQGRRGGGTRVPSRKRLICIWYPISSL